MTVPSAYAIRVYVNDVDVTDYCPFDKLAFEDYRHTVSKFDLVLENAPFIPTDGMNVYIFQADGGDTVFVGNIVDVTEKKHDNGIVMDYEVECADRKAQLLKSVVPYDEYVGLDTEILEDLLDNAYPDLSGVYDFTSNVNNIADNLDLPVNDDNLLDLLDKLSEQAGSDYHFEKGKGNQRIQFSDNLDAIRFVEDYPSSPVWYDYGDSINFVELGRVPGGQPGNCLKWTATTLNTAIPDQVSLTIAFGGTYTVSNIVFDVYFNFGTSSLDITKTGGGGTYNTSVMNVWQTVNWHTVMSGAGLPFTGSAMSLIFRNNSNAVGSFEIRLDNIRVFTTEPFVTDDVEADTLEWDSEPPASDFDLDIDLGSEFGANFDLNLGGWDSYNAVIVTGGSEAIAIDWTYPASGYQKQINLEKQVKDLVVYKNMGSDGSPSWTLQTLGKWGVDDIGSKDVIYDELDAWLLFNTEPTFLRRAVRITGSIKKPIRVLVSNAPAGVPVYATTVYNENATTEEAAFNIGSAFLAKRNLIRHLEFETLHPGLKVGQTIGVTDSARGLSEQLIIQHIRTTWIGASGHAKFEVECGDEEFSDASNYIALNDKRSREKAPPVPIGTSTYEALSDDLGENLTDDFGQILYAPV